MTETQSWREGLRAFFDTRGEAVAGPPSHEDLCYIAGRDPRVWMDPAIRDDLARSIVELSEATADSSVLEVGSAAGFLAQLVAPRVARFTGIDLADGPLKVARRLGLLNADFRQAEGERLPFETASFDCAFCYDVFTNFPSFEDGAPLIVEMLRVVKPGGRVLVGSIPDRTRAADLPDRVAAIARDLESKFGPYKACAEPSVSVAAAPHVDAAPVSGFWERLAKLFKADSRDGERPVSIAVTPMITTFDFAKDDFAALGRRVGADVSFHDIHPLNPYFGYRFNVVYSRARA